MVPSRQSCFAALAAGLLWLGGVLPAHALHAPLPEGIPISPAETRVGDFSRVAAGRLSLRDEFGPANTPGWWVCGYKTASGRRVWKLYGPDLNGKYGGMNGTGGFDGVSPYLNTFYPTISDCRGNILGEVTNGVVSWFAARPTGYGAVPGRRPVALGHGADIAMSSAWRGHEVDITGYYQIGMRTYDPVAGMWLSYDPVWNAHDPNGMSFCSGDPINGFDPDGRCFEKGASAVGNYLYSGGSYGQEYRDASSILNYIGDNTSSPTLAGLMGFASYFTDKAANNVTPSYYVNQAGSDYSAAGGGVTGVLGVGNRYNPTASAYDFFSGYDLINGQTLSGVDRASAGLNTLGGALLLGAGVADSFQPGTTPPVTTTLYRAVTDEELNSVQNSGQFSTVPGSSTPVPGVQGKWFYGNLEDAQNWAGQAAARDGGPLTILQTTVPKTVAPVYSQPWVDSIQNPALFYNIGDLNAPIKAVSPPITGGAK